MLKKIALGIVILMVIVQTGAATTLEQVKKQGVLRHLGVGYANFNTGTGDGLDTELMQIFAKHLGVKYQHVKTTFATVITDLTGIQIKPRGTEVDILGTTTPKGDIIANGLTILPWRQKVINYSIPTFPTQVWLIATADSTIQPITPSGNIDQDIQAVKALITGKKVLSKENTCLDAGLYGLSRIGAEVQSFAGGLGELAPAIIQGAADVTLIDVPDALVALEKWGSKIKVIGPLSKFQGMGVGFTKDALKLKEEFNRFLAKIKNNGTMYRLVEKYYPLAFQFYPDFFKDLKKY